MTHKIANTAKNNEFILFCAKIFPIFAIMFTASSAFVLFSQGIKYLQYGAHNMSGCLDHTGTTVTAASSCSVFIYPAWLLALCFFLGILVTIFSLIWQSSFCKDATC